MKIKTVARELKDADVRFISLVAKGANRIPFRIIKSAKDENQMLDLSKLGHVLKSEQATTKTPANKAYSPGFAQILAGSVNRNIGDEPPQATIAPAKPVQSIAASTRDTQAQASGGKPAITRQAHNAPKQPTAIPSKGNPVEFATLQQAIDAALSKQRDEEKAAAFNDKRSAFSRLAPTRKSDVEGGGLGSAHALRNFGGKLAASILNSTTRKDETRLPTNTGFRAVSGASLKG